MFKKLFRQKNGFNNFCYDKYVLHMWRKIINLNIRQKKIHL